MQKDTMQKRKQQTPAMKCPTTVSDVADRLLKLIFRRLDSQVSFIRAAAVCTRWRRVASTRGFANQVWHPYDWHHPDFSRSVGDYHVVDPSLSPAPRSPQPQRRRVVFIPASPCIDARHFTLDFLPAGSGGRPWELVDGCGSLLLLANQRRGFFPDLVICDPISRDFVRIPRIENLKYSHCLGVFLNRNGGFSLTCVLYERSMGIADGVSFVTARVYNHQPPGHRRRWRRHGWSSCSLASSGGIHVRGAESAHYAGRSKGMMFWGIQDDGSVLALRQDTGVFCHFRLPEHVRGSHHRSSFRFVEDDDGVDSLVRVVSLIGDELRVFLKKEHNNGGGDWVLVRSLHLNEATRGLPGYKDCFFSHTAKIVTAGKGYVVLTPVEEAWMFTVELGTMQVEREHIRNRLVGEVYPYALPLRPKVRACVFDCRRGRDGPCYDICKCK